MTTEREKAAMDEEAVHATSAHDERRTWRAEDAQPLVEIPATTPRTRLWRQLGERDGYDCRYCDGPLVAFTPEQWPRLLPDPPNLVHVEHLTPKSRGGTSRLENLGLSCLRCNLSKGTKTAAEFVA